MHLFSFGDATVSAAPGEAVPAVGLAVVVVVPVPSLESCSLVLVSLVQVMSPWEALVDRYSAVVLPLFHHLHIDPDDAAVFLPDSL